MQGIDAFSFAMASLESLIISSNPSKSPMTSIRAFIFLKSGNWAGLLPPPSLKRFGLSLADGVGCKFGQSTAEKVMATTPEEERVIEILVRHPPTHDHFGDPIHDVDTALGWNTPQTTAFVSDLVMRKLIVPRTEAINTLESPDARSRWWWERP